GSPSDETPPGNIASIGPVGEKPSHRALNGAGSTGTPGVLTGMPSAGRSSRTWVAVDGSCAVYVCDGHGKRQPWPPSGLHASGIADGGGGLLSPLHAATTRIVRWVIRRLDGNIRLASRTRKHGQARRWL